MDAAAHICVLAGKKYGILDVVTPLLTSIRKSCPAARLQIFAEACREQVLLRDTFHAPFLKDIKVTFTPLVEQASDLSSLNPDVVLSILEQEKPDVLLVDDRLLARNTACGIAVRKYAGRRKQKVFIVMHGMWQTPVAAAASIRHYSDIEYEYWLASPEPILPLASLSTNQVVRTGCAGFDSSWLKARGRTKPSTEAVRRCLYLIRKIVPDGTAALLGDVCLSEFTRVSRRLLVDSGLCNVRRIVIKPYPTMQDQLIRETMNAIGVTDYEVCYDSIHSLAPSCDLVLGELTGAFFVPQFAEVPSVMLGFSLERTFRGTHRGYDCRPAMDMLRPGWHYYIEKPEEIDVVLRDLWDEKGDVSQHAKRRMESGIRYMRKLFPDGAAERCLERMRLAASERVA